MMTIVATDRVYTFKLFDNTNISAPKNAIKQNHRFKERTLDL